MCVCAKLMANLEQNHLLDDGESCSRVDPISDDVTTRAFAGCGDRSVAVAVQQCCVVPEVCLCALVTLFFFWKVMTSGKKWKLRKVGWNSWGRSA